MSKFEKLYNEVITEKVDDLFKSENLFLKWLEHYRDQFKIKDNSKEYKIAVNAFNAGYSLGRSGK